MDFQSSIGPYNHLKELAIKPQKRHDFVKKIPKKTRFINFFAKRHDLQNKTITSYKLYRTEYQI